MLNYIWAGLIIFSLVFALVSDISDLANDTYRNGEALPVELRYATGTPAAERRVSADVLITGVDFGNFYGVTSEEDLAFDGTLVRTTDGIEVRFASNVSLPEPLATVRQVSGGRERELRGVVLNLAIVSDTSASASVLLPPVRFTKMTGIAEAAIDFADTAVSLVIGLIGALALWMGLLQIAEASGMLKALVRFTQPLFRKLFPEIPEGHPAIGMIVLNLSANMLGLGNAATPLGLKAMEELQELNPSDDTATNSMVMLLALNTASVQVVPPVLLVAIMGLQINQLFFSILLVTLISAVVAVVTAKLMGRLRAYRESDPMTAALEDPSEA